MVVSTDSEQIAEVARHFGAEVPFLRPQHLAGDYDALQDVTNHCIEMLSLEGYNANVHCILTPPHPFRQPRLINQAIKLVLQGWHNVHVVRAIEMNRNRYFIQNPGGILKETKAILKTCSGLAKYYRRYGNLSVFAPGLPTFGSIPIEISNPIELIDIDTPKDLELAREVIRLGLYNFDAL